jgi:hypothetical protein
MKSFFTLTLLLVISVIGVTRAQAQSSVVSNVVESLVTGNPDGISNYFGDRVEITLFNQTNIYSSTQARYAIRQFFSDYPVDDFALLNTGDTGGTSYILGILSTARGKFKVNVYIKTSGPGGSIDQIRFELK